jgi:hypothetical protein
LSFLHHASTGPKCNRKGSTAGKSDADTDAAAPAKVSTAITKTIRFAVQIANHHEVQECACQLEGLGEGDYTLGHAANKKM